MTVLSHHWGLDPTPS